MHNLRNVVLHHSLKRSIGPGATADPAGQLRVPDQVVASDLLASTLGDVDDLLTTCEGEAVLLGLGGVPLHGVAWSLGIISVCIILFEEECLRVDQKYLCH